MSRAPSPRPGRSVADRVPAHAYFVTSAIFHNLGPAFAVLLFAQLDVLGVAWIRIATAAIIFLVWTRPWQIWTTLDLRGRFLLLGLGVVLAVMNSTFYLALDRLPLATVSAIEFVGPVVLAFIAVRSIRNAAACLIAFTGVALLMEVRLASDPLGFVFAGLNCLGFVLYVMLGHRVAAHGAAQGIRRLGASMIIAMIILAPVGFVEALPALSDPVLLLAAVGVGICSSVIPYVCDQLAMARLSRGTFAMMLALLPATGCLIGALVLHQIPTPLEVIGVGLVVGGVALHRDERRADRSTSDEETRA
ncbi:DMT family transporter [Microbacterium oxydans]|uniref:EamA family transporter n=1 Tax=Microbacterium oxydans TaxID=82380 RepID=UPI0036363F70